jgi:hypothetical protein
MTAVTARSGADEGLSFHVDGDWDGAAYSALTATVVVVATVVVATSQ